MNDNGPLENQRAVMLRGLCAGQAMPSVHGSNPVTPTK